MIFDISTYPHCVNFTISPICHSTIWICSPFHHFTINFVYHFIISPYQFVYSYTVLLNKLSQNLTQHLYKYYILKDNISKCSESEDIFVNSTTFKYEKAANKYETSMHITSESLDNFPNLNSSKTNDYARPKCFSDLVAVKSPLASTI